jgi:hypothetical protein
MYEKLVESQKEDREKDREKRGEMGSGPQANLLSGKRDLRFFLFFYVLSFYSCV